MTPEQKLHEQFTETSAALQDAARRQGQAEVRLELAKFGQVVTPDHALAAFAGHVRHHHDWTQGRVADVLEVTRQAYNRALRHGVGLSTLERWVQRYNAAHPETPFRCLIMVGA